MTENTDELAHAVAKINARVLRQQAKDEREKEYATQLNRLINRRNGCWMAAGASVGIAAVLAILFFTRTVNLGNGTLLWPGGGLTLLCILGAVINSVWIAELRATKRMDDMRDELREEIRDARPADAVELARISALLEEADHDRKHLMQRFNAAEQQRESDLLQGRELIAKRFEDVGDQIERLHAALPPMLIEASRQGFMARFQAAIDATAAADASAADTKYLADMAEAMRLGRELERRESPPPDASN